METRKRIKNYGPVGQSDNLDNHVFERIQFQEQKRLANTKSVIYKVTQELGDKEVPDQEPDHDWTARFFSSVQDVSSEEMQILWAKILAGQVERPDSTSLRTLSVLQEMDRNTAELFKKFCSMCIYMETRDGVYDGRVCSLGKKAGVNSLQSYGLNFMDLNRLHEYGLVISDYDSAMDYSISQQLKIKLSMPPSSSLPFRFQDIWWYLMPFNNKNQVPDFKIIGPSLSISGMELSRVVECKQVPEFKEKLWNFFQTKNLRMMESNITTIG